MSEQMTIRSLSIDDLPQCHKFFPTPQYVSYEHQITRQSSSGYSLFGCFIDGHLVGMIHLSRQGAKDQAVREMFPIPVLGNLLVHADYRQQGLGSQLIYHCEDTLRSEGYSAAGLIVSSTNNQAIKLYEKVNYQPMMQLPPRPHDNAAARIYYQKTL